jgi:Subtilase family
MLAFRRLAIPAFMSVTVVTFAACGGGGGSGSNPAPRPTPTPAPTQAPTTCRSTASDGRRVAFGDTVSTVVPNRLYVTYRATASRVEQSIDRSAGSVSSLSIGSANGLSQRAITLPAGSDMNAATARLRATAGVVDVAPVHTRYALTGANDPYFNNTTQWYLFKTDTTPDGWSFPPQGLGVTIAVIDTGVDETNVDLAQRLIYRERVVGGTVTTGAGTVQDTNGHGTNVTGLADAETNNAIGFASVGHSANLAVFKIFPDATATSDCQTADTLDEARAIQDAVAHGASVINLSLGAAPTGGFDQAEHDAVEAAIAAGVTVVAAGGNDKGSTPDFPGGYPGVISVGATTVQDTQANNYLAITSETIASYSNSGVTLVAPGGDPSGTSDNDLLHWIEGYSTTTANFPGDKCSTPTPPTACRALFAGTSQATPLVTGTVALMMAYHGGNRSLSPAQVTSLLTQNADSIGQPAASQGAGRLNVGRAVGAAHP